MHFGWRSPKFNELFDKKQLEINFRRMVIANCEMIMDGKKFSINSLRKLFHSPRFLLKTIYSVVQLLLSPRHNSIKTGSVVHFLSLKFIFTFVLNDRNVISVPLRLAWFYCWSLPMAPDVWWKSQLKLPQLIYLPRQSFRPIIAFTKQKFIHGSFFHNQNMQINF